MMRIGIALCLLALNSVATIVQGHDVDLPACNETQLNEAVALFPDYYALIEAGAAMEVSAASGACLQRIASLPGVISCGN